MASTPAPTYPDNNKGKGKKKLHPVVVNNTVLSVLLVHHTETSTSGVHRLVFARACSPIGEP